MNGVKFGGVDGREGFVKAQDMAKDLRPNGSEAGDWVPVLFMQFGVNLEECNDGVGSYSTVIFATESGQLDYCVVEAFRFGPHGDDESPEPSKVYILMDDEGRYLRAPGEGLALLERDAHRFTIDEAEEANRWAFCELNFIEVEAE